MTERDIAEIPEKERATALYLIAQGTITVSEAAALLGISRQIVHHWTKRDEIDPAEARADYLRRLWFARLKRKRTRGRPA